MVQDAEACAEAIPLTATNSYVYCTAYEEPSAGGQCGHAGCKGLVGTLVHLSARNALLPG